MKEILPLEKVIEIVHKTFNAPISRPEKRKEVISDEDLEKMATEAYNKYKRRIATK